MLKIKLVPTGKKHQISYRVGICEAKSKVTGRVIEKIGFYHPQTKKFSVDSTRLKYWQEHGAQITAGLRKILNP